MKKLLFHLLTLSIVLSLFLTSCGPSTGGQAESNQERVQNPALPLTEKQELVAGNTAFAVDFYKALAASSGNMFYSPYSISLALAMTYAGARGDTADQMAKTLHFPLPQERLHPAFNALDQALKNQPAQDDLSTPTPEVIPFEMNIANSLWGQKDFTFLQEFLDTLASNYGAGMELVDFSANSEKARRAINAWVAEQTQGKIKDLIPPGLVDPSTVLVLANAIYFKAGWVYNFNKDLTADAPFTLLDGSRVSVPMMSLGSDEWLPYNAGDGWQAVALPYQGWTTEMVILLPAEGQFSQFEQELTAGRLDQILAGLSRRGVALSMPKFGFTSQYKLEDTLRELGMPLAFAPGKADFSGMDGRQDLSISFVVHKALVNVDESGTEAAAATAVGMALSAMLQSEEMKVDRPFIFLIRDTTTGSILFMGRVLDPSK